MGVRYVRVTNPVLTDTLTRIECPCGHILEEAPSDEPVKVSCNCGEIYELVKKATTVEVGIPEAVFWSRGDDALNPIPTAWDRLRDGEPTRTHKALFALYRARVRTIEFFKRRHVWLTLAGCSTALAVGCGIGLAVLLGDGPDEEAKKQFAIDLAKTKKEEAEAEAKKKEAEAEKAKAKAIEDRKAFVAGIRSRAKHNWAMWHEAYNGEDENVCYHSDNFSTYSVPAWYRIRCLAGPAGEAPAKIVVCDQDECRVGVPDPYWPKPKPEPPAKKK